ncbi:phage tail sheath family protein [Ferruginibacter sp.]
MSTYKTPGVYIEEQNAFPNSAVAVATAVPVFIGYTQKAERNGKSVIAKPTRISSMAEYVELFGKEFNHKFLLNMPTPVTAFEPAMLNAPAQFFYLYNCMRLFFANGGGNCYIVSVGTYGNNESIKIKTADFTAATIWTALEKEIEPTLVVIPDMVNRRPDCYGLYNLVLQHCKKMQSRMGIFDVIPDANDADDATTISVFRADIGPEGLNYGAAYYPFLNTTITAASEIDFNNLAIQKADLVELLWATIAHKKTVIAQEEEENKKKIKALSDTALHQYLLSASTVYQQLMEAIRQRLNLLPPSAAMAGIYTMVDNARGVWKAPANVSVAMVNSPAVNIDHNEQESMNVDVRDGKSVNAIRVFTGQGTLVWGARTLDGNSQDWRYITVRRTMIMIEQSLKLACRAYVFEPNVANTWVTVKSMAENFLTNLWKQGGLAGAKPEDAFTVDVGLGSTMTPEDILDGYLNIIVKVAVVRPAEFIVITFQQQQQKS